MGEERAGKTVLGRERGANSVQTRAIVTVCLCDANASDRRLVGTKSIVSAKAAETIHGQKLGEIAVQLRATVPF